MKRLRGVVSRRVCRPSYRLNPRYQNNGYLFNGSQGKILERETFFINKRMYSTPDAPVSTDEPMRITAMKQIIFTCKECNTQVNKKFTKHSYEKGVVLIQCDGCQKWHFIADNLGFTGWEAKNIEEVMAAKGEVVRKGLIDPNTGQIHVHGQGAEVHPNPLPNTTQTQPQYDISREGGVISIESKESDVK
eukprot:TRINITY_DN3506_c0_g1_i1.p1 TRINITY_DN3506_c0_g1~~TRINITY_DN3506_c0_g1_i1.p1  ORF type:complete len:202 (-),score=26.46 TRINITY_DN3506_c0_g1_i1:8-577(-)